MNAVMRAGSARRYGKLLFALACVAPVACARHMTRSLTTDDPARLEFTNATSDRVTVYLSVEGARPWLLGSVDGFRTSFISLPSFGFDHSRGTARLLVVPLGTSRMNAAVPADFESGPWQTFSEPTEDVLKSRWTFVGKQLFSAPSRPRTKTGTDG